MLQYRSELVRNARARQAIPHTNARRRTRRHGNAHYTCPIVSSSEFTPQRHRKTPQYRAASRCANAGSPCPGRRLAARARLDAAARRSAATMGSRRQRAGATRGVAALDRRTARLHDAAIRRPGHDADIRSLDHGARERCCARCRLSRHPPRWRTRIRCKAVGGLRLHAGRRAARHAPDHAGASSWTAFVSGEPASGASARVARRRPAGEGGRR